MTLKRTWDWGSLWRRGQAEPSDSVVPTRKSMTDVLPSAELLKLGWTSVHLEPGEVLFEESDPAEIYYIVVDGRLSVRLKGVELAQLTAAQTIGEASVFLDGEVRTATAVATQATELLALSRTELHNLRDAEPALFDLLLVSALQQLGESIRNTERQGSPLLDQPIAKTAKPQEPTQEILQVLATLPGLRWVPQETLADIRAAGQIVQLAEGDALFEAGQNGDTMFLVLNGSVAVQQDDAVGVPFEAGSLIAASYFACPADHVATATATGPVDVLSFSSDAFNLEGEPGRVLKLATLEALRLQISAVNIRAEQSQALRAGRVDMVEIIAAAAQLEGWRAGDPLSQPKDDLLHDVPTVADGDADFQKMTALIQDAIIGKDAAIETPYGLRRVVYADYTASGRSLAFIEDFIRDRVMPLYANTHTEASASGLQTTRLRDEAREAVAHSVNAGENDEVLFVGSGATGAINRIIDIMGLRGDPESDQQNALPATDRPVVFIGPYEHHSNILPWRHSKADVVEIDVTETGELDTDALEAALIAHKDRPMLIGSFSAASNVTGLATDVTGVTSLLHAHGAYSFWDYAAAGPYVPIDMNPKQPGSEKDAIFISPHKFVGGPGTPGLLILKSKLVSSSIPSNPGGGTVDFVTASDSLYSTSITDREESGTPAIIESIRCGLAFKLKDQVGAKKVHDRETAYVNAAIKSWSRNPKIRVLGPLEAQRISITSLLIRHGRGYLHYNFVVALLNDLFGIQSRGGCSCAGPYGARLLGLDQNAERGFSDLASQGLTCFKPGWTRVNFNYFIDREEFEYIVKAVHLIAAYGHNLLPDYSVDVSSGIWSHRAGQRYQPASLSEIEFGDNHVTWRETKTKTEGGTLAEQLRNGEDILRKAQADVPQLETGPALDVFAKQWRWFPLPEEQAAWMRHVNGKASAPEDMRAPLMDQA